MANKKEQGREIIIPDRSVRKELLAELGVAGEGIDPDAIASAIEVIELSSQIQNAMSAHFNRYGLTQARFLLLMIMSANRTKRWSPVELAEKVGVRAPTMTGILDGMVRDELVTREHDQEDRRRVLVSLTRKGTKKMRDVLPDHFGRITNAFVNLNQPDTKKKLHATMQQIYKSLETLTEGIE